MFEAMSPQAFQSAGNPPTAGHILLRDLIDYAGLFPPASLAMQQSVANYDAYLQSEWNWILGRFIVPAARLSELEAAFAKSPTHMPAKGFEKWRLSALLGSEANMDIDRINEFNARMANPVSGRVAVIESVEAKVANARDIERLASVIPTGLATYFEVPLSNGEECLAAGVDSGRRVKIRMGGETADKFPAPASVIEFIRHCASLDVP